MEVEIMTMCDAATEHAGKMNILGTFNSIYAHKFPCVHAFCSIAICLRFEKSENGEHSIRVLFVNEDGQDVIPPFEHRMDIHIPPNEPLAVARLIFQMQNLLFQQAGTYAINLEADGEERATLPFFVRQM
jgi:hypothetical protein